MTTLPLSYKNTNGIFVILIEHRSFCLERHCTVFHWELELLNCLNLPGFVNEAVRRCTWGGSLRTLQKEARDPAEGPWRAAALSRSMKQTMFLFCSLSFFKLKLIGPYLFPPDRVLFLYGYRLRGVCTFRHMHVCACTVVRIIDSSLLLNLPVLLKRLFVSPQSFKKNNEKKRKQPLLPKQITVCALMAGENTSISRRRLL